MNQPGTPAPLSPDEAAPPHLPRVLEAHFDPITKICSLHGLRLHLERELEVELFAPLPSSFVTPTPPRLFVVTTTSNSAFAEQETRSRLLFVGEGDAAQGVAELHRALEHLDPEPTSGVLPQALDFWRLDDSALLLTHNHLLPFAQSLASDVPWFSFGLRAALPALIRLAKVLESLHQAGFALGGLRAEQLVFDLTRGQVALAQPPRLLRLETLARPQQLDLLRRDLRSLGVLLLSAALRADALDAATTFPRVLDDAQLLIDMGLARPGLPQILLGTLTSEPPFAYHNSRDLLLGLLQLQAEMSPGLRLRSGMASSVGNFPLRRTDQDSCGSAELRVLYHGISRQMAFFCVADGVGGEEHGERASQLAVQAALRAFHNAVAAHPFEVLRANPSAIARAITKVAAQELAICGELYPDTHRGATTFTGAFLAGDRVGLGHVGDSRAYLLRDERLTRLTRDHNVANMKAALDQLTGRQSPEREDDQRRISRFLGSAGETPLSWIDSFDPRLLGHLTWTPQARHTFDAGHVQTLTELSSTEPIPTAPKPPSPSSDLVPTLELTPSAERRVFDAATEHDAWGSTLALLPGDQLLLMSDGLYGELGESELLRILLHEPEPERAVHLLLHKAMLRLSMDNLTIVQVRLDESPANFD